MNCTTPNCYNEILCKSLCIKCYYRVKRGGTPLLSIKQKAALRICSIEGCEKPHTSKGLCAMHRKRLKIHGDPLFINPKCNRDGNYIKRARSKTAQWKKDNKKTYNAYLASRKSRVKQVTPKWADLVAIRQLYFDCPKGYHVDHIIPLNGKNVSGLHTLENLRYLPAQENLTKSNKYR